MEMVTDTALMMHPRVLSTRYRISNYPNKKLDFNTLMIYIEYAILVMFFWHVAFSTMCAEYGIAGVLDI